MTKFLGYLLLILIIKITPNTAGAVTPYEPVIKDPLLEKWRWIKFPALSSKGISKFDGTSWTNDIFPSELTIIREGGSLRKSLSGSIWINKTSREWNRRTLGGRKELTAKMKKYQTVFYKPDAAPPQTRITIYEQQVYQPGNTIISWQGQDLWSRTPVEKLQFSYRINSGSWSPFSYKTNNIFLSLPDDDHVFEVRSRDLDYNIDPNPSSVRFNVAPPFYRHPLFYIPMLLLSVIIILLQIRVVRRGRKLRAAKKETDNILHVDPPLLREFIVSADQELKLVEELLSAEKANKYNDETLKSIFRSIHLIKGNASLLALKVFSEQAHEFEDKINEIQVKESIQRSDLNILRSELNKIKKTLNEVNNLLERIGKIHEQMRPRRSYEQELKILGHEKN